MRRLGLFAAIMYALSFARCALKRVPVGAEAGNSSISGGIGGGGSGPTGTGGTEPTDILVGNDLKSGSTGTNAP